MQWNHKRLKYHNFAVNMWVAVLSATLIIMAKDKRKTLLYLIPEGETRDSHTYHYTFIKTKNLTIDNKKLKLKKYNPVKRKHEWFVEAKLPPHSK